MDSADEYRLVEAANELHGVLDEGNMNDVPVVVVANKQDLPGAMDLQTVSEKLCLSELTNHRWHIQAASATAGVGVQEAMMKMAKLIKECRK